MKKAPLILPILLFASLATLCAQTDDPAFLKKFESSFETGGLVNAPDFVPAELMTGALHSVDAQASNDGLRNTYLLKSGFDVLAITGTPALLQRIHEIYALDYLRGLRIRRAQTQPQRSQGSGALDGRAPVRALPRRI